MGGAYIVAQIPEQVLKEAVKAVECGYNFTISLNVVIAPETVVPSEEYEIPVDEINRLTSCLPVSSDEIINAHKRRK